MALFRAVHCRFPVVRGVVAQGDGEVSVWSIDVDVDDFVERGGAVERDYCEHLQWSVLVHVAALNDHL